MNILFIGLPYHKYTAEIINELNRQKYNVKYYPIKLRSLLFKIIQSISQNLFMKLHEKYHNKVIKKERNNEYDIVLFLQVHFFSKNNLIKLKKDHSKSIFILYNWDSITNHDYRDFIIYFDKVFTFDSRDAKKLNINYLPLFCISEFQSLNNNISKKNSVYFIGNLVSVNRYVALNHFIDYCNKEDIIFDYYLKCSPVVYMKLLLSGYFPKKIYFFDISFCKFKSYIETSSAVFDYANHIQTGYTMRLIENLCAGKKIITNNPIVMNEQFYSEDRILVFNDFDFSKVKNFLNDDIKNNFKTFPEFHINNFIKKLLT